jgi:hypothetical protein
MWRPNIMNCGWNNQDATPLKTSVYLNCVLMNATQDFKKITNDMFKSQTIELTLSLCYKPWPNNHFFSKKTSSKQATVHGTHLMQEQKNE